MTAALVAWSFATLLPSLTWLVAVAINRDATDRMGRIRDGANVVLLAPVLAAQSAIIWLWSWLRRVTVATVNAAGPALDWRKPWEYTSPEASQALGAAIAGVFFLGVLTLVAATPGIPGVDAQCTNIDQFSQCTVGPFTPVTVGAHQYYLNNTAVYTIGLDWENDGDQSAWFSQYNLQGTLNCPGPIQSELGNLVNLHGFALDGGASVTVGGALCLGLSAGVSFNIGPISPVLAATAVYCPSQTDPVSIEGVAAQLYADFSTGTTSTAFVAQASTMPSICQLGGPCHLFPVNTAQNGYDLLFITASGVSTSADGALAAVRAPQTQSHQQQIKCTAGTCTGLPQYPGDCPSVRQSSTTSPGLLAQGAGTFDPTGQTFINPQFATDVEPAWAVAAAQCIGTATDQPGFYSLPGFVTTAMSGPSAVNLQGECQGGGTVQLAGCLAQQTELWLAGQQSPVPTDNGRPVVFTCDASDASPAVWYSKFTPGPPPANVSCINSTRTAGLAHCEVCGNFTMCHPPGRVPYFDPSIAQALAFGNSSVNNYKPGGNYCRLRVLSAGKDWITVQPRETPCITAGQMGDSVLHNATTFQVPIHGWAIQASGEGYLYWYFRAVPEKPSKHNTSFNISVAPVPRMCFGDDCSCTPWDCGADPICQMADSTNWESCKCAFSKGGWVSASVSCKFLAILLYTLFWGGIGVIALLLLWAAIRHYQNKPGKYKTQA